MTRGTPPKGYCTATVARRKLGNISDGKFRTLIGEGEGKIERIVPAGGSQGYYRIADVNALALQWSKEAREVEQSDGEDTHFRVATKEDMPEIVGLLIKVFGGGDTTEKRNTWLDRNPKSAFVVRSHGKVRGCIFILSVSEEKITGLFGKDSYGTSDIEAKDILPFEIGKPTNLFLLSMASDDVGAGRTNRRKWGSMIVRGLFRHIEDLGKRGIPVRIVASRSSLPDGIRLMRHIGFWEMEPYGKRKNFIIEMKRSGLDFAMKYKAAYREWMAQHE